MTGKDLPIAIATTTMDVIGSAYGMAGIGAAINPLMRKLLHLQDEQVQSIRRLEKGMQQLINAPWQTARYHLEECRIPGRSPKEVKQSLRKAADKFREALGMQQPRSFAAAYVAYDLAVVLALAEDKTASRHYAEKSAEAATNAVIDLIRVEMTARNTASGLEALINEGRSMINEVRVSFEWISERVFGKAFGEKPKQANQLMESQFAQLAVEDWYGIVEGASKLCKRDLYPFQYARLELWLT